MPAVEDRPVRCGTSRPLGRLGPALTPDGLAVVSELSWLKGNAPDPVREFFRSGYPDMRSVRDHISAAERAGYEVPATHTLPRRAWVDGYYDVLAPRAKALLDHPETSVREFAAESVREVEAFECSEDSYGYVFYVLRRA